MHPFVADKLDQIRGLCEAHSVNALYLFGSATSDEFDPQNSDLDFLVDFLAMEPGDLAVAYFALLGGLEDLFGRKIDLIANRAIENPYFREAVDARKVSIYAAA